MTSKCRGTFALYPRGGSKDDSGYSDVCSRRLWYPCVYSGVRGGYSGYIAVTKGRRCPFYDGVCDLGMGGQGYRLRG